MIILVTTGVVVLNEDGGQNTLRLQMLKVKVIKLNKLNAELSR